MVAGQYTYDQSGQSYFFFLTILLIFLLPFTYSVLLGGAEGSASRVKYPCAGWNSKSPAVRKAAGKVGISKKQIILALGWVLLAFVVQRASHYEADALIYDPFKILGISTAATEKEIKKHYRKMSLKFHPDKLKLSDNQTLEEANNHFVDLTKAYKSLTDETIRHNFEKFGHPDGKQEYDQGIALPSWVVESRNIWWVMGAYALVLGVMLPLLVGRWWYSSRKLTKDGVLNSTASIYYHALKEHTPFPVLLDILAASDEFTLDATLVKIRSSMSKAGIDEYARLASTIREGVDGRLGGWEKFSTWSMGKKRARVFLAAHMLRVPITDANLLREKLVTVTIALPLTTGLSSIALASNWLSAFVSILRLQQFLLQAVHPTSSPLLQLPHLTNEVAKAAHQTGVDTVAQFGKFEPPTVEKLLNGFSETEKSETFEVAKNWPVTTCTDAKFEIAGETTVTPGAVVCMTLKLRISPPGKAGVLPDAKAVTADDQVSGKESSTIEELIGRRKEGEDGEEPTPLAHAPHFPKNRKPTWYVFTGDHKLNRVFIQPQTFTDMGPNRERTIRIQFQAPPGPGLYTFQTYVMCDSYVGTDVQKDMRMTVQLPSDQSEALVEEDDISEPDEDSIAGQMAMMKGEPVRKSRLGNEDDDDTSGTEEEESDDSSDSDSD